MSDVHCPTVRDHNARVAYALTHSIGANPACRASVLRAFQLSEGQGEMHGLQRLSKLTIVAIHTAGVFGAHLA